MNIMNCTCEYCGQLHHIPGCPNYDEPELQYKCSICGYGIEIGDEYIENSTGEFAHVDCMYDPYLTAKFFGEEIHRMQEG